MSIRRAPSYLTFPVDSLWSAKEEWVTAVHPLILYQPFAVFSALSLSPPLSISLFQVTEEEIDITEAC